MTTELKQESAVTFSDKIFALRAAASSIYDRGMILGKNPEDLAKDIKPLSEALDRLIIQAAQTDLPSCVIAVQRLESMARAHDEDAKYLIQKAQNNRHHARDIKDAIIEKMKRDGVTERHIGAFTAVLTHPEQNGLKTDVLILR
jgi:hypothetical protein